MKDLKDKISIFIVMLIVAGFLSLIIDPVITGGAISEFPGWANCKPSHPCSHGIGDCDKDTDCQAGLTCEKDVGGNYYGNTYNKVDVCERGTVVVNDIVPEFIIAVGDDSPPSDDVLASELITLLRAAGYSVSDEVKLFSEVDTTQIDSSVIASIYDGDVVLITGTNARPQFILLKDMLELILNQGGINYQSMSSNSVISDLRDLFVSPVACPTVYDPVCGSDGNTYDNSCVAITAGVITFTNGACTGGGGSGGSSRSDEISLGSAFDESISDNYGTLDVTLPPYTAGLSHELKAETSLTSNEDDYQTDVVLEVARDSIKYHLNPPFNRNLVGQTITLMGISFKITSLRNNGFTIERNGFSEVIRDGDAFFNEDVNNPDWIWDIDTNLNVIGIENDFIYNDDSDNPPKVGECIRLPNNYASICLDSLSVADNDYDTYTIEYDNSADLSDADVSLTSEDSIYIHTSKNEGIKLDNGINTDKVWITGDKRIFYMDLNDNNVKYLKNLEVNGGLWAQASIGTISEDLQLLTIARDGMVEVSISSQMLLSLLTAKFSLDGNEKISALGNIASSEESGELIYSPLGDATLNIGTKDEDHRTDHGIVIRDPKAHGANDEVVLDVPIRQVKAKINMEFGTIFCANAVGGCALPDERGVVLCQKPNGLPGTCSSSVDSSGYCNCV